MDKYYMHTLIGGVLIALVGCQVASGDRSLSQYSADASITTSVKTALFNNSQIPLSRIHVETDKGTVLLSGFVRTFQQKSEAGILASQVRGVSAVQNNLIVRR